MVVCNVDVVAVLCQGWVFNSVPWLVSIPCQWFSGWLADRLVGKGQDRLCLKQLIQCWVSVLCQFLIHINFYTVV